ncbi:hypothetical protein T03_8998 [Trichinella britovi]|uniref:Uncharacterized protein n=1 Tax=Trichinella britovi TaxID=45882 RepID=A0A0V0YRT0_TRIBR|nr:hypothetical protein T03_8998 [Trichinella britovi]
MPLLPPVLTLADSKCRTSHGLEIYQVHLGS